ncbi:diacylglycerol kinase family protein [Sediminicola luteus]|uniref:Diacylglycerol kinase n=1 Tax=Sediminicola luteus TaxID=319238 RepID=A0A2A4G8F1_9FLAO|nr:diacylglycerol kinase family protein [Sediminicola luteus]PCE64042.1 diacylglycerol kinase [Sediminicola luteus]
MPKQSFVIGRLKSIGYALKGVWLLARSEASVQVQLGVAVLVTLAGFYFDISQTEWMYQFLAMGLVIAVEGLNTAVEKMADYVQPEHEPKIGVLKDVAAGAVLVSAFSAAAVGLMIYLPKIF